MSVIHAFVTIVLASMQVDQTGTAAGDNPEISKGGSQAPAATVSDPCDWLVNLARHQGHLMGRTNARSASLQVLALLDAATRVDPNCAEAYEWSYDLLGRLGRDESAVAALANYVRLRPDDESAHIRFMELEVASKQTSEDRTDYVRGELSKMPLPRCYESALRCELAKLLYERRENNDASREVETSLRLNPMNVRARELAYEMFGETEPALQRVELALQMIAANPSQINLLWDFAEFLDDLSLNTQAQEWYNRAIDLHRRASATNPVPANFWYKLAVSYSNSGDFERARLAAGAALKQDPDMQAARLVRSHVARKLGDADAADADLDAVQKSYNAMMEEVKAKQNDDRAAEIAWFFAYYRPDKVKALEMSNVAMAAPHPGSQAQLAHAFALRLNGRDEDAVKLLEPLSAVDQTAALELAKTYIDRDDRPRALTVLHKAATLQYSGIAFGRIREMLGKYGEIAPERPLHTSIVKALERFNREIFDYHKRPEDFLHFTMRLESDPIPAVGPVRAKFRLENVGPFPITFGEGFMARPLIAISAIIGEEPGTSFDNYLQVMMGSKPVLLPGDAIEKTVALDVGAMRDKLIASATRPQSIAISAIFDPIFHEGELTWGLGSIAIGPINVSSRPIDATREGVEAIMRNAASAQTTNRIIAAESLGAILASVSPAPNNKQAAPIVGDDIDAAAIRGKLSELIADPDWRVRAHALVACGWSGLDEKLTIAAAPAVRDADPIVRALAVRLFAEAQGEKFNKVLDAVSEGDPDSLVRTMARSFLPAGQGISASAAQDDKP